MPPTSSLMKKGDDDVFLSETKEKSHTRHSSLVIHIFPSQNLAKERERYYNDIMLS